MDSNVLTWESVAAFCAVVGLVISMWARLESRMTAARDEAKKDRAQLYNKIENIDAKNQERFRQLERQHSDLRSHLATNYRQTVDLDRAEERTLRAIAELKADIHQHLTNLLSSLRHRSVPDKEA